MSGAARQGPALSCADAIVITQVQWRKIRYNVGNRDRERKRYREGIENEKHENDIDTQWMSPDDYMNLLEQKAKEGKADEPITDDEFREYLLGKKWKKQ